ncbi:MAG TPA: hypothetical protein VF386_02700, partial [Usitatibacter sp.]
MIAHPAIIRRLARLALACVAAAGLACGQAPEGGPAATLRAKYAGLHDKLERNAFGRELYLSSREESGQLTGEVYGVLEFPFAQVASNLREARSWCDVLILPYNTKHCYAAPGEAARTLAMRIGRKTEQPAELAYPLEFNYQIAARTPDYFRIVLSADKGPIGTRDYRIVLEATPLDEKRTFIHFGYAYAFGAMSRLALQVYLGTVGASKVGFTVTAR